MVDPIKTLDMERQFLMQLTIFLSYDLNALFLANNTPEKSPFSMLDKECSAQHGVAWFSSGS